MNKYILAIDQGTTGTRAIIFNKNGLEVSNSYLEHQQIFPNEGWVEHNPEEILENTLKVIKDAVNKEKLDFSQIKAIGITNQRETIVAWNKENGKPLHNAIVWQCRRTANFCEELRKNYSDLFRKKTGLVLDPYFSGTKIRWLIDNVPKVKDMLKDGRLQIGTIDSWIIYNLTGNHVTDYSNSSRTLLMNIHKGTWDDELIEIIGLPKDIISALPDIKPSSDKNTYGETKKELFTISIPVSGAAGDQQAALFGQTCFQPGSVKNTYGTGNFLLQNTGKDIVFSKNGLLSTVAWKIDNDQTTYALEGSVFITGALLNWLKNKIGILPDVKQTTDIMNRTPSTEGVYLVPAFVGLGAPYWDSFARGIIIGLTQATTRDHIIRAGLESIVYQSQDVIDAMKKDSGKDIPVLRVDGGVTNCDPLLQFQSDISQTIVQRPLVKETTALGAAYLAGLAVEYWENLIDIEKNFVIDIEFTPHLDTDKKDKMLEKWHEAVKRSKGWIK
ncbi:MAG: glycerol kinase GlpK [Candidatus Heimdallarchaeum endolithica]|uniref:Glycerol kinase n=1 Tax=Candidatus Heimdallarchaeum endolithica TaxID=2876572 RepID=A0A9Y1FNA1_9ARCH|nr:MAG: glycerol kinase GlpK [Candidatus Heimdallarchaeum endolithica]